jgi:hypothetical protein
MKLTIKVSKSYGNYLRTHLAEEHPKTRGKIKLR